MSTFDFFRKHQKLILYTAGIFALVSFSVTGALTSMFGSWFAGPYRGPTMKLPDGSSVVVTEEDHAVAQRLANVPLAPPLLPTLVEGVRGQSDLIEVLAALRRLAIEYGIDGSQTEVDAAVAQLAADLPGSDGTPITKQALAQGAGVSVDTYDRLQREALRIASFVRLTSLATDLTDAELAEQLVKRGKLLTVEVASLDKAAIEEELKEQDVSDDDLRAWIDGLDDVGKAPYRDTNHVALKVAAIALDQFDPAHFAAELDGKEFDDQAITDRYNRDREVLYRKPDAGKPGDDKPGADKQGADKQGDDGENESPDQPQDPDQVYRPLEEVKDDVRKRLQAEAALAAVWEKVKAAQRQQVEQLEVARGEKQLAVDDARVVLDEAKAKAEAAPEDAELKAAVEAAQQALTAAEAELQTAQAAIDAARQQLDLEAMVRASAPADASLEFRTVAKGNTDALRDLPELGKWSNSWAATAISEVGELGTQVHETDRAMFVFQVTEVEKTPLKPFDDIREQAREAYFRHKADDIAKQKREALEAALDRLGREARKEQIDALEAEFTTKVDERVQEWQRDANARLQRAQSVLVDLRGKGETAGPVFRTWQQQVDAINQQLAEPDAQRQRIHDELRAEYDGKIETLIDEAHPEVLAAAAAEAGWTVETVGPLRKDVDREPRFRERYPKRTVFLFGNAAVKDLEKGKAAGIQEDFTNRALHLPVMRAIEDASLADVSRRLLLAERAQFEQNRLRGTVTQSFSIDALTQRYHYKRVEGEAGEQREDQPRQSGANSRDQTPGNQTPGNQAEQPAADAGGKSK